MPAINRARRSVDSGSPLPEDLNSSAVTTTKNPQSQSITRRVMTTFVSQFFLTSNSPHLSPQPRLRIFRSSETAGLRPLFAQSSLTIVTIVTTAKRVIPYARCKVCRNRLYKRKNCRETTGNSERTERQTQQGSARIPSIRIIGNLDRDFIALPQTRRESE